MTTPIPAWMWAPFTFFATVLLLAWWNSPATVKVDPRGRWIAGTDTLLIGGTAWGRFNGAPFTSRARENKMLLHLPASWPNDDAVVTIFPDSLTMTTGIRTLLHEGDTLRVFKR